MLADLPPMLREIVKDAVSAEPDMEVTGEFEGTAFLRAPARADVVIAGTREPAGAAFPGEILSAWPSAKVLMIAVNGPATAMYELRCHKTPLGDISPGGLVQAIRHAVGRTPTGQTPGAISSEAQS